MSRTPWGLYYSSGNNRTIVLPLLCVTADASIKELAAQVKLTQTYFNDTDIVLEAAYSFPIPARAAVCSCIMIKQDGTRVVGFVLERQEARETYESALAEGKQAALVVQQTPDVFQLAVGNIPPQEKVQIELIYATELSEDEENDSVRFHLPVHVGARYGSAPAALVEKPSSHTNSAFLEIFVNVEAVAPIAKIGSPSHTVSTELGPDPALLNAKDLLFSNYARVSLSSETALDKDFVLTIKSAGLDAPRCVAEVHPTQDTVAMGLTLVPRFKLPDLSRQEFVFLVDRSGSMQGRRIAVLMKALIVMLRSLPAKDSLFQIASFGTTCTMLWDDGSRPYNQATLDEATGYVDSMQANYGGTEIRSALQRCFDARKTDRPTSVFVLTDGEAWDLDGVLAAVRGAVARAPTQAYLRVSVLGIGKSTSTAMCEGIARVGNGTCMMVGEQETTFTGKIARLLKAARSPLISDIAVNWGVPALAPVDEEDAFVMVSDDENEGSGTGNGKAKASVNIFDETLDPLQADNEPAPPPPEVILSPIPQVQQSPFKIRTLSPGNRLNVYAILQGKTVPETVTLTGSTEDGTEIRLSVPVTLSNLPNAAESPPAIHALAARKIIQDLEDGQHSITTSVSDDADLLARTIKASIVRLAMMYSISSSQTSFVAVDGSGGTSSLPPGSQTISVGGAHAAGAFVGFATLLPTLGMAQRYTDTRASGFTVIYNSKRTRSKRGEARAPTVNAPSPSPQTIAPASTPIAAQVTSHAAPQTATAKNQPSKLRFCRMRDEFGYHGPDPLEELARRQSFDGCFSPDVLSLVQLKVDVDQVRAALGVSEEVFATVMAMAFLSTKLAVDERVERGSWEAMYDKARAFVEEALQNAPSKVGVDELKAQAVGYFA